MALPAASATAIGDVAAIIGVLAACNAALHDGARATVLSCYSDDSVLMPSNSPSRIGKAAIWRASDAVFEELRFIVDFDVAELVVIAPTWASVLTNSAANRACVHAHDHRQGGSGAIHIQQGR